MGTIGDSRGVLLILVIVLIVAIAVFRRPLTRAVLVTTEIIVLLLVVLLTLGGAVAGFNYGGIFGGSNVELVCAILGGLGGFVIAALLAFFVLTLAQIERNTRRTVQ
jgi:uncharacterized membrane protein